MLKKRDGVKERVSRDGSAATPPPERPALLHRTETFNLRLSALDRERMDRLVALGWADSRASLIRMLVWEAAELADVGPRRRKRP